MQLTRRPKNQHDDRSKRHTHRRGGCAQEPWRPLPNEAQKLNISGATRHAEAEYRVTTGHQPRWKRTGGDPSAR
jgi:hypothetical protein